MVGLGRRLFFLMLVLNLAKVNGHSITRAFYHRGRCEDKLVFYFDHDPQLFRQTAAQDVVYLFQNTQLTSQVHQALDGFRDLGLKYDLLFVSNQVQKTLKIQINLASQFVTGVRAYQFTPISAPYGIVIKILHVDEFGRQACALKMNPKEIVLDFGHGGRDIGTKFGEIYEKDVVKKVGLKLANILTKQGYVVHLTRLDDEFVPLDLRTYFANLSTNASLFVSLHANHATKPEVCGIETHRMDGNLLQGVDFGPSVSEYDMHTYSARLAKLVQEQLLHATKDYGVLNRRVKRSVSQVLLGVEMPAILVELGFLSNPQEAQLLNSQAYQLQLAQGISKGINSYMLAV